MTHETDHRACIRCLVATPSPADHSYVVCGSCANEIVGWRCEGCGATFDGPGDHAGGEGHTTGGTDPYDGEMIAVSCGPVRPQW